MDLVILTVVEMDNWTSLATHFRRVSNNRKYSTRSGKGTISINKRCRIQHNELSKSRYLQTKDIMVPPYTRLDSHRTLITPRHAQAVVESIAIAPPPSLGPQPTRECRVDKYIISRCFWNFRVARAIHCAILRGTIRPCVVDLP